MSLLHDRLAGLLPQWRAEIDSLQRAHGAEVIDRVTAGQVLHGMRGIHGLVCDTSSVDPQAGLAIRGRPVLELAGRLPEEAFWLLLTGELPAPPELAWLQAELAQRAALPPYVPAVLSALPPDLHAVTQYSAVLLALQRESRFARGYGSLGRAELWRPALDDALDLLAWAPQVAGLVYHRLYAGGPPPPAAPPAEPDYAARIAAQLAPAASRLPALLRLHFVVHSDHESGSASAFACHTVGSALADPFLALTASLSALAGPIHGMAAQTCLEFVAALLAGRPGSAGLDDYVTAECWARLQARQVIPGFGHAVLRSTDPRFVALRDFGRREFAGEPLFEVAEALYRNAPLVLTAQGSAKSVQPNVDGISGVLLYCAGLRQPAFYTILFSLGQMLGLLAQYVLARGLGTPLMRPRSVTLAALRRLAAAAPG
jgi:citrate synthase